MRKLCILLAGVLLLGAAGAFAGCNNTPEEDEKEEQSGLFPAAGSEQVTDRASLEYAYGVYGEGALADEANGFTDVTSLTGGRFMVNGSYRTGLGESGNRNDIRAELYNGRAIRCVDLPEGYAFTLPAPSAEVDYSISQYRTQYTYGDAVLTATFESKNPYTADEDPWYLFAESWLLKYLNSELFGLLGITALREPAHAFTRTEPYGDLGILEGYDVYRYDLKIEDGGEEIARPFYHIAVIRAENAVKEFALFVLKAESDRSADMDAIVQSYVRLPVKGVKRTTTVYEAPPENPRWNAATKAYYESFISSDRVKWGVFSASMPGYRDEYLPTDNNYKYVLDLSRRHQSYLEEAWDFKYDIYPTYTALQYAGERVRFPVYMAEELAGGDGTNGKPVLQCTYQFTANNNLMGTTPMFDILRGKYDGQFRELAQDIKNYQKPVLFRLNNEMNTDWTSYCGLITLLDPDIFVMTWKRLYGIFEEVGVDNSIWIWNPNSNSMPYGCWGEDLCYFPGREYVQLLGGTYYELNNYTKEAAPKSCQSFKKMYTELYRKNAAFREWSVILSEFGCGSGGDYSGELGRNRDVQLKWVREMFEEFNDPDPADYIKQIKGAVWFNANDYNYDNGTKVTNRYQLYDPNNNYYSDLLPLMEEFRRGLSGRE